MILNQKQTPKALRHGLTASISQLNYPQRFIKAFCNFTNKPWGINPFKWGYVTLSHLNVGVLSHFVVLWQHFVRGRKKVPTGLTLVQMLKKERKLMSKKEEKLVNIVETPTPTLTRSTAQRV